MSAEMSRLVRFGVTGGIVALIYVVGYTVLYHAGLTPFVANTTAFLAAVAVQYVMQTCWTFKRRLWSGQQSMRFIAIIGIGLVYSTLLASVIAPVMDVPPWLAAGFVAVTLPIINYISFRLWVFGPDPMQKDT